MTGAMLTPVKVEPAPRQLAVLTPAKRSRERVVLQPAKSAGAEAVAERLCRALREPERELVAKIVEAVGQPMALEFREETMRIVRAGGMRKPDGNLRTPGGIFFLLAKEHLGPAKSKEIWAIQVKKRRQLKAQRLHERAKEALGQNEDADDWGDAD